MVLTRQMLKRQTESNAISTAPKRRKKINEDVDTENDKVDEGLPRWEDLNMDCLTNVLGRVGMESLILGVPFVCKSWYASSLNPLCWQRLYFPDYEPSPLYRTHKDEAEYETPNRYGTFYDRFIRKYRMETRQNKRFSITSFIKNVVNRSNGKALELKLPGFCTEEVVRYVAKECPQLRVLCLPDDLILFKNCQVIHEVIGDWKLLEKLSLGGNLSKIVAVAKDGIRGRVSKHFKSLLMEYESLSSFRYESVLAPILEQIGLHCNNFTGLELFHADIGKHGAQELIVKSLPNLKYLWASESYFNSDIILTILQGCKELDLLLVRNCKGLMSRQKRNIAASYKEFRCEGQGTSLAELQNLCLYCMLKTDRLTWSVRIN